MILLYDMQSAPAFQPFQALDSLSWAPARARFKCWNFFRISQFQTSSISQQTGCTAASPASIRRLDTGHSVRQKIGMAGLEPSADGSLTHQVPRDKGIVSTILFCLRQYHAISPLQKRGDRIAKAFVQFLVYRIQWRYVRQKCFFGVQQARGIAKLNVGIIRMVQVPCKIEQLELSKISPRSPAERAQRYLTTGGGTKISSGCSCLLIARRRWSAQRPFVNASNGFLLMGILMRSLFEGLMIALMFKPSQEIALTLSPNAQHSIGSSLHLYTRTHTHTSTPPPCDFFVASSHHLPSRLQRKTLPGTHHGNAKKSVP